MSVDTITHEFVGNEPEKYRLDELADVTRIVPSTLGIQADRLPASAAEVTVIDPFVVDTNNQYPNSYEYVQYEEKALNDIAQERREKGEWSRVQEVAYTLENGEVSTRKEWGDQYTSQLLFEKSPALAEWHKLVPSARALTALCDPFETKDINGIELDDTARVWMSNCTDAIGIRSRGAVLAELADSYVRTHPERAAAMRWMSVACGTALPAMKAAMRAGLSPELTLLDWDRSAMEMTQKLGEEIHFGGQIDQIRRNIFDPKQMDRLRERLTADGQDRRPDVMDLMGIFEYTGDNLGVSSSEFLKANYGLLRDGGRMIFGQMRADRPNMDFTMGAVRWPYVETRTPDEVMKIIQDAGIPTSSVRMYLPKDGVYMVVSIDKPAAFSAESPFGQEFATAA